MAFWVAMVYRGARAGGLREARSLSTRSGSLHFPHDFPDCSAGLQQQQESREEAIDKHVRRPPAKRVNYSRLGVPAPFHCPFTQLIKEWQEKVPELLNMPPNQASGEMYVLRCRQLLLGLQEAMQEARQKHSNKSSEHKTVSSRLSAVLNHKHHKDLVLQHLCSLVPVVTASVLRGVPSGHAIICVPSKEDVELWAKNSTFSGPEESLHQRCKTLPDKTKKKKKSGKGDGKSKPTGAGNNKKQPSDHGKSSSGVDSKDTKKALNARQLEEKAHFLKEPTRIMDACDRPVIGFFTDGDFDLGQGHGSGIGFCSLVGLLSALQGSAMNQPFLVLFRNPVSRQYRFAHLSVVM